ncbi:hypothetical protein [Duganella sp. FT27W]|uniref:hypothetical protein n=1 Tax=Duganella sp. FT27W TaxID=2654636 RepID=UPI00128D6CDB|nr:hypothetical protein [Duganella sp. FT27W]MPQ56232.1 hypothetical protein [Duganella sp. FT27W]
MTLKIRGPRRFESPGVLRGDAPFLGATVAEWDRAILGNMEKTLAEIKLRTTNAPKRDASKAVTSDLASSVSKRLAGIK